MAFSQSALISATNANTFSLLYDRRAPKSRLARRKRSYLRAMRFFHRYVRVSLRAVVAQQITREEGDDYQEYAVQ